MGRRICQTLHCSEQHTTPTWQPLPNSRLGPPTPPRWDSISFADDLKHAYVQICQPLGFNRTNSSKNYEPHLQRNITAQLCERRPARDLAATLNYRLRKLTKHPRDKDPLAIGAIKTALATAAKASGHVAWQLILSWCNAWNTDRRVAQSTTPCRFGCRSGADDLTHYIRCRNLITPCSLAAGLPPHWQLQPLGLPSLDSAPLRTTPP